MDLKSLYLLNTRVVHVGPLVFAVSAIPCLFKILGVDFDLSSIIKQGTKGKEIEYLYMKMAEYLLPTEKKKNNFRSKQYF